MFLFVLYVLFLALLLSVLLLHNNYNLYYKGNKLNNRPISEEEKTTILENKEVFKQNKVNKTLNKINTNEIHFIKTIII